MLKNLKIIVGVLVGLLIAGGVGYSMIFGNGAFHVLAPEGGAVTVSLDGEDLGSLSAGTHQRYNLKQGEHVVTLTPAEGEATEHSVNVENGMYDDMLPLSGQCLAVFDVTNYWYEENRLLDKLSEEISVELKSTDGAAFDHPAGVHYSTDDLPMQIQEGHRVELMMQLPCESLTVSDEQLILDVFGDTVD